MFDSKKTKLFDVEKTTSNSFIKAGLQEQEALTKTENGSIAYINTGDPFVDQFGSTSLYKIPRPYSKIAKDCETLWNIDQERTVKFMFFLRIITRKVTYVPSDENSLTTKEPQKGAELRYESIMRYMWLSVNHSDIFWKNAWLIPFVGSWKDIFLMLRYDLIYNGWEGRLLNWKQFGNLICSGLGQECTHSLVKKYLPQIKAKSKCKTVEAQANCLIGKWISSLLFCTTKNLTYEGRFTIYRRYSKLKASGTAHEWQQLISKRQYNKIDFNSIHAKALGILAKSKFFDNHGLRESFTEWVTNDTTKVKATEFVHELFVDFPNTTWNSFKNVSIDKATLINKKFNTLIQKGMSLENKTKLIVVRDTSSSMTGKAIGTNSSAYDIGKALALYFSEFLSGPFSGAFLEFNHTCKLHTWKGNTPLEKWLNDKCEAYGSTNLQSVIETFIRIKDSGVSEEDFPTGIICVSDGEFDNNTYSNTSVIAAKTALRVAGFSENYINSFVMVFWNIPNNYYNSDPTIKFQTIGTIPNVFYFSGYSGSIISFLNGQKTSTAKELFDTAMNQEILNLIKL